MDAATADEAPSRFWWIDPYSDNPIAVGLIFLILIVTLMVAVALIRILFVHQPGSNPIPPPSAPFPGLTIERILGLF